MKVSFRNVKEVDKGNSTQNGRGGGAGGGRIVKCKYSLLVNGSHLILYVGGHPFLSIYKIVLVCVFKYNNRETVDYLQAFYVMKKVFHLIYHLLIIFEAISMI